MWHGKDCNWRHKWRDKNKCVTCTVGRTCKWWIGARSEKSRSIMTDPACGSRIGNGYAQCPPLHLHHAYRLCICWASGPCIRIHACLHPCTHRASQRRCQFHPSVPRYRPDHPKSAHEYTYVPVWVSEPRPVGSSIDRVGFSAQLFCDGDAKCCGGPGIVELASQQWWARPQITYIWHA